MKTVSAKSLWHQVKNLRFNVTTLWRARRHPDMPIASKVLCVAALIYAISPVDLIPDMIPVLGYVDDAVILPMLLSLAVRLLPEHVVRESGSEFSHKGWVGLFGRSSK